ncbi:MAG: very short patch repair endonuclease [Silanimonas sp.]|nr:very short patch repair endonuclease [Silanimonas sp.]
MSRIRSEHTRPELQVRQYLWRQGFRYRLHGTKLAGKPDVVLPKWRAVVFIHGCFWHRHEGCPLFRLPKTRQEFWDQKLRANQSRDKGSIAKLTADGWRVAVVWECTLRSDPAQNLEQLAAWIRSDEPIIEIGRNA